jgi:arylsulfatase A-like enzyme
MSGGTRRDFLRIMGLSGAASLGLHRWLQAATTTTSAPAGASGKPNVLFILTDDQRPDAVAALGNKIVKTPNLDSIVERGFVFSRAYCMGAFVGAVCLPSRTMIYTGKHLFHLNAKGDKPLRDDSPTFPQAMKAAGYATIRSGKFGNNPNEICRAFDDHVDGKTAAGNADNLIEFLHRTGGRHPVFLNLAANEPHDPQYAPPDHLGMYKPQDIPPPVNFLPQHPFDNGELEVRDEKTLRRPLTKESVTGKLARYYASVTYLDAQVGRILAALKQEGQLDNTIIVFASDNGLSLGEHGLLGKQNLYEFGGMHVPLVFAGPGVAKGRSDALAYLFDIFPTVCELAGEPAPKGIDGRSLVPVIRGKAPKVRDAALTAYKDVQRAVRDDRWKLIHYPRIGKDQLFDLSSDPHEMTDLSDKPEHAEKVKEMLDLLARTQKELGDTCQITSERFQQNKAAPTQPGGVRAVDKE